MYVIFKEMVWELLTSIRGTLFQSLKDSNPDYPCKIRKEGKIKEVKIKDLEDHSVWRNTVGLFKKRR